MFKFIRETEDEVNSAIINLQDLTKLEIYAYFLAFLKGCGYHFDTGVELVEHDPSMTQDPYIDELEETVENLETRIKELEEAQLPTLSAIAEKGEN